ncbi:MAG: 50S ribosomal protein L23 [Clostridiales bacterium]|nr:50S ribosomal protein L23 [Clostridiales bacterium]MCC8100549.1 50S ribosomal protein L23 [Clostridiales bacterium]MCD7857797.1 50S ribosomal protein L23 [Clostridiales bacterium]MCD7920822.1 50S ribosomal protein L23 [Clostridiales bacterium]MCD8126018.1 50S ribosomal protein L23 [Clostridiales bacterium]
MTAYDIIRKPVVTEASMMATSDRQYTFVVDKRANKTEIASAIEKIFDVKVEKVNTMNYDGKKKRMGNGPMGKRPAYKKAVVKLTEDSKTIELFDEMV